MDVASGVKMLLEVAEVHICRELSVSALVLKLLTALVVLVTSVIGCITRAVPVMVGCVFSGAACLNVDFLHKAGPTDGRFLTQILAD